MLDGRQSAPETFGLELYESCASVSQRQPDKGKGRERNVISESFSLRVSLGVVTAKEEVRERLKTCWHIEVSPLKMIHLLVNPSCRFGGEVVEKASGKGGFFLLASLAGYR